MRIGILTVSDLGAVGQREDTSGDEILTWATERGYDVAVRSVVPDESDRIAGMLARWADSGEVDVILTTGGTGLTRGVAGTRGKTLIVNLPGSTGGVTDGLAVLEGFLEHAVELVSGSRTVHG